MTPFCGVLTILDNKKSFVFNGAFFEPPRFFQLLFGDWVVDKPQNVG